MCILYITFFYFIYIYLAQRHCDIHPFFSRSIIFGYIERKKEIFSLIAYFSSFIINFNEIMLIRAFLHETKEFSSKMLCLVLRTKILSIKVNDYWGNLSSPPLPRSTRLLYFCRTRKGWTYTALSRILPNAVWLGSKLQLLLSRTASHLANLR